MVDSIRSLATMVLLGIFGLVAVHKLGLFSVESNLKKAIYQPGERIPFLALPLTSVHTQLIADPRTVTPFYSSDTVVLEMLQEVRCKIFRRFTPTEEDSKRLSFHIRNGYHQNWRLDGIVAANTAFNFGAMQKHYAGGFPLGFVDATETESYIFNHVTFRVDYHPIEEGYNVVSLGVEPTCVKHRFKHDADGSTGNEFETCPEAFTGEFVTQDNADTVQIVKPGEEIIFTYDVTWQESAVNWEHRWNVYLTEDNFVPDQVHIYSIYNSVIIVVILSSVITCILIKNLKKDVAASNRNAEDERKGWKTLHEDVFRPPQTHPGWFCALVGQGVQLAITIFVVLVLAFLNAVSPVKKGSILTAACLIYVILGSPLAGYVSGRLAKNFAASAGGNNKPEDCRLLLATTFPSMIAAYLILLIMMVPPGTTRTIGPFYLVLWACFTFGGGLVLTGLGWKKGCGNDSDFPTETSTVAREIPPPKCGKRCTEFLYLIFTGVSPYCASIQTPVFAMLYMGAYSYVVIYVELFFTMTSLFMNQYYWSYGYCLIVYIIVVITTALLTLLLVYHRLNNENHQWWWPAFLGSGSVGLYIFGYSIIWVRSLELSSDYWFASHFLYFGKTFLIGTGAFCLCGSMGTLAALGLVCKLFSTVRPENNLNDDYVELLNSDECDSQLESDAASHAEESTTAADGSRKEEVAGVV